MSANPIKTKRQKPHVAVPSNFTRSGTRRMGDDYQDAQALDRLMQWLEDNSRFRWVKVESDDGGALDDIQLMSEDGGLEVWQVKFSTAPNKETDAWTWERLLKIGGDTAQDAPAKKKRGPKRTSLLHKWFKSWEELKATHPMLRAGLLSNRHGTPDFSATLEGCKAQWHKLPDGIQQEIARQLGDSARTQAFLDEFEFHIEEPNLRELAEAVQSRFARLGGTPGGWHRLEKAVRRWTANKREPAPNGCITIDELYRVTGLRPHAVRLNTFRPPVDYFAKYLRPNTLFHHATPLVGRRPQRRALLDFVAGSKQVALLPGRGGIGKSRLLFDLCRRLARRDEDLSVRLVGENLPLTENSLQELSDERCLVIVDDAHRREDLAILLGAVRQYSNLKLLLSTRPQATDYLEAQVRAAEFITEDIELWPPLPELRIREIERLARRVLGREWTGYSYQLADVTRDCPLLTVLGGQLLREHKVAPELLAQDERFRREVLQRFRDIMIGEVVSKQEGRFSRLLCIKILPLIAVATPLQCDNNALIRTLAELANTDALTFEALVDELVKVGAMARGGHLARIVPDVLSDYILQEACFRSDGHPTGWAWAVFDALGDIYLDTVLRNLAELDWRIRTATDDAEESDSLLLDRVWDAIEGKFRAADCRGRINWLDSFTRLSFMQSARLWRIVEIAVAEPVPDEAETENSLMLRRYLRPSTQDDVLAKLPPLLKGIAYDARFTGRCADLLWQLGRNQQTQSNASPSALATLRTLASGEAGKPFEFAFILLECCRKWLRDPQIYDYQHSILPILGSLLSRRLSNRESNRRWVNRSLVTLPPQPCRTLRDSALTLIKQCALTGRRIIVIGALRCLQEVINEHNLWGLDTTDRDFWEQEQLNALNIVACVVAINDDPFVRLAVREVIHEQAERGSRPKVRAQARAIWASFLDTHEMQFILVFTRKHAGGQYFKSWTGNSIVKEEKISIQMGEARFKVSGTLCRAVTNEWVKRNPLPADGFIALEKWITDIAMSGWWNEMWTMGNDFLLRLALDFPTYAIDLCTVALTSPETRMAGRCYDLLCGLRSQNSDLSLPLVRQFMASHQPNLMLAVAQSYSWRGWPVSPLVEEYATVRDLLAFSHPAVRHVGAGILPSIAANEPRRALDILIDTEIGTDSKLAGELFTIFEPHCKLSLDLLSPDELAALLNKLVMVDNIENYHVGRFLLRAVLRAPVAVAQMLVRRVEQKSTLLMANSAVPEDSEAWEAEQSYVALPSSGFHDEQLKGIIEHPAYPAALRLIRDASLTIPASWNDDLAYLFRDFALTYNAFSLDSLNEWINSGDCARVQDATRFFGAGYLGFYAENIEFLSNFLQQAEACGHEVFERVERALLHNAEFGPMRAAASLRGERSYALIFKSQETLDEVGARSHALITDSQEALQRAHGSWLVAQFFQKLKMRGLEMRRHEDEERALEEIYYRS